MGIRIPLPPQFDSSPFTRAAGLDAGLGAGRLRGSDLQRPFHGVRHGQRTALSLLDRCLAFQTRMPDDAFFCSVTAAAVMGLPLPFELENFPLLHVAVPSPSRGLTARGVVGHKVGLMGGDVRLWHGIRISSPERAWCELSSALRLPEFVAVGDYLIHWRSPLTTTEALAAAAARYPGRRGQPLIRAAVPLLDGRAESPPESVFRVIIILAGFDGLEVNYSIAVPGYNYRADLAFPCHMVVIEYHGDYHRNPEQWRKDLTRKSRLEAAGWFVLEFNADDLKNPVELLARIRVVLRGRPKMR